MKKGYWSVFSAVVCAALMTTVTLVAAEVTTESGADKAPRVRFEAAQSEEYYLEGAVPVENGKVVFRREIQIGLSQQEIFDRVKDWLMDPPQKQKSGILDRLITYENREEGIIKAEIREYLVFTSTALALDRAQFAVSQQYTCLPGKCVVEMTNLRYYYEEENQVAEGWITDDYALSKDKKSIYKGLRKVRVKTIDWVDEWCDNLLSDILKSASTSPSLITTPTPAAAKVTEPTVAAAPAPVPAETPVPAPAPETTPSPVAAAPAAQPAPTTPAVPTPLIEKPAPVASAPAVPFSVAETPLLLPTPGSEGELAGYKRIDPDKIPGNIIKMLNDDWMLITAGTASGFNMMTASWGGLGVLFGKPSAFCFINPQRYTYQFMDRGDTYTLSFYTEAYRDALKLCGSVSGRDTDKVKASGLTPITTPSGAPAFSEAWMIVECRKLVVQPLSQEVILDPAVRQQFEGKPVNTMFVGEILNVWIK